MSSISGISSVSRTVVPNPATPAQKPAAVVKDADGDFDGTRPGQFDPRDAGKGLKVDKLA